MYFKSNLYPSIGSLLFLLVFYVYMCSDMLFRYGGLYLDSDILVLRPLSSHNNTVGLEDLQAGSSLNGAVMSFGKHR